ncbi:hypothetical protein SAMN05421741_109134 [Paenimyroides ummariense]|uniref:Uncharacterized protein n=1 Tax=Paenimyroides ummariense TaxID=913024 RepID=A0A1I5BAZ0_9FLAO|nr:hypothetical protein [Paenimyroides ummariense]SFN71866.1 hypothetical protein SAMN05421741_109134 [Paenimyroides ummariense]
MNNKSRLIPKKRMWISLAIILLPVLILLLLKLAGFSESLDFGKLSKIVASISLVGMFLLFMTQWTKDDGDEMYLQMRLSAVLLGVITGITTLLISSLFSLIDWLDLDYSHYNGFGLMFFILLMILSNFGQQIYSLSKQKEE